MDAVMSEEIILEVELSKNDVIVAEVTNYDAEVETELLDAILLDSELKDNFEEITTEFADIIKTKGTMVYTVVQDDVMNIETALAKLGPNKYIEGDLIVIRSIDKTLTMCYLYTRDEGWIPLGGNAGGGGGTADYRLLVHKPSINGTVLENNYDEIDPTVPDWAKTPNKPSYTADEINAITKDNVVTKSEIDLMFLQVFNM